MMRTALAWTTALACGMAAVLGGGGVASAADGAALWEKNCAACHGADGKGDTKAGKLTKVTDLTSADVKSSLTADKVKTIIKDGVTDPATGKTRMKGYKDKFSAEEVDALAAHVMKLSGAGQ